ncbi:glycosyltransferase [Xanthomonas sp. NCPPB 2654]|uniref:glycosyltransferase n=1 Tax=unclassified Xanthomonas TaxID=2643310 RepID=UPI0021E0A249|nr:MULTISPECIES: glycosyltransferase [unclassified Xanthomonas]MDL5365242.1 glycosyltransferase [Xanthomonas sp. NCPPB 2654]UYC19696.1 glycosyltransferase [Xanthomonas sp. CFBP 8443]
MTKPTLLVLASTYPRWRDDPEPGFVHELARRLTDRFRVVVLCPHANGALEYETMDSVEIHRYRYAPQRWETLVNDGGMVSNVQHSPWKALLLPGFFIGQLFAAYRAVRRYRPTVVHAHWLIPQGIVATALSLAGSSSPFLVTSHGGDLYALKSWPFRWIKRAVIRRSARLAVVSEGMLQQVAALGADMSKVVVEPMGADLSGRFVPDPTVPRSRTEILFVGRLVEKKGLRFLIAAMHAIRAAVPGATLTVAGFGPELEMRKEQVRDLELQDAVRFLGAVPQSELPSLYRRAALFVAPFVEATSGDQDGLGLVLIEALGCGCPVLVSAIPAVRRLAETCNGVHTVPPGSTAALADAISRLVRSPQPVDPNEVQGFDWHVRAGAYAALLDTVMRRCEVASPR